MNKLMMTVGFLAGLITAGGCGILLGSYKMSPRKMVRKTARMVDDMVDSVGDCIKHRKRSCF